MAFTDPTTTNPTLVRPKRCTYIVRFWVAGIGYGRQERDADNAIIAGTEVREIILHKYPDADVVVIAAARK